MPKEAIYFCAENRRLALMCCFLAFEHSEDMQLKRMQFLCTALYSCPGWGSCWHASSFCSASARH